MLLLFGVLQQFNCLLANMPISNTLIVFVNAHIIASLLCSKTLSEVWLCQAGFRAPRDLDLMYLSKFTIALLSPSTITVPHHSRSHYAVPLPSLIVKLIESLLNLQGPLEKNPFSYKDPLIILVGRKHASINNLLSLVSFYEVYL